MSISFAGFIYSSPSHHYDHIASLCIFLDLPLIVTEEEVMHHLQKIYPSLVVHYFDYLNLGKEVVSRYTALFSCHPRPYLERMFSFSEELLNKRCVSFFIPHGNSDKGHKSQLIEGIKHEALVGVYGKKMLDFFTEKGVSRQLFGTVHLGNYREKVYCKLKPHFLKLLQEQVSVDSKKKTILFAPTWDDAEQSCSLFSIIDTLLKKKPEHIRLLIKPHPNTFLTQTAKMEQLQGKIDKLNDTFLIRDFPPIYTLLDIADIYLGDMSSIGYDFLTYNRPMFFLNPNNRNPSFDKGLQLMRCGEIIYPESFDVLYDVIEHPQTELKKARHDMYHYTFGNPVHADGLKKECIELTKRFLRDAL